MKPPHFSKSTFVIAILLSLLSFQLKGQADGGQPKGKAENDPASGPAENAQPKAQSSDSSKTNQHFELSFGQALLFISDSKVVDIRNQHAVVVPTSSLLFFAELRPQKKIRVPLFLNLPTESQQFIVNGQLFNERAKPAMGFGLEFKLFQIGIDKKSKLEMEIGPLASFFLTKKLSESFAPLAAGRVRVTRGEHFVMYFGSSYAIGINTFGILYGTGTVF